MKGRLAAWGCLAALGLLLARSAEAAQAVRDGLALCAGSVIPALFPFLAVSGLLTALDAGASPALGPLARLLGCSRAGARAFLLGLTGSYPVGARTVAQLYRRGGISRREACRLLLFSNNCGPAFILGVAGLGCFGSLRAGVLLWGVHILAALVIALALPRQAAEPSERPGSVPARPPLVPALIAAVRDAAGTMVYICGFVVFFLMLLRVMGRVTGLSHPVLSGAVELTQGILALPHTRRGFVWAAGLLGWGGLSVHGQSAAVLSGTDLPMGPYLAAKAAHAAVSVLLAWPVSMCL
jgi:hypothetical protein